MQEVVGTFGKPNQPNQTQWHKVNDFDFCFVLYQNTFASRTKPAGLDFYRQYIQKKVKQALPILSNLLITIKSKSETQSTLILDEILGSLSFATLRLFGFVMNNYVTHYSILVVYLASHLRSCVLHHVSISTKVITWSTFAFIAHAKVVEIRCCRRVNRITTNPT